MRSSMLALVAFGLSAGGTYAIREYSSRRGLLDRPNPRSSHTVPTPRLGGVAIAIATVVAWLGMPEPLDGAGDVLPLVIIGAAIAALVGLTDDLRNISPPVKFAGELLAVTVPLSSFLAGYNGLHLIQMFVAAVLLLSYINFFNFMDGSDGMAAGVAVFSALGLAVLARQTGADTAESMALAVAAAAGGFLVFNYPPASIFMGDAGSLFLGYALGLIALTVAASGAGVVAVAIVLAPFWFDAGFTLVRRALSREVLWRAHRTHLYQRLLRTGVTHLQVATLYSGWTVTCCALAWAWGRTPVAWRPGLAALSMVPGACLVLYVQRREGEARRSAAVVPINEA